MAYKNKIIRNTKTGQEIKFLQTAKDTDGQMLEMQTTWQPFSQEPAAHYHPIQEENFLVEEGELHVKLKGELSILKRGDALHIPANLVHAMWNNSPNKTIVNWKVHPALDTENLFETSIGLAADNKTNKNGMPGILQVALIARRFSKEFRLAKPTYFFQFLLFSILKPFAVLAGYKAVYPKYID